jgi:hypothetical protein
MGTKKLRARARTYQKNARSHPLSWILSLGPANRQGGRQGSGTSAQKVLTGQLARLTLGAPARFGVKSGRRSLQARSACEAAFWQHH